jgi:hypothetical protein
MQVVGVQNVPPEEVLQRVHSFFGEFLKIREHHGVQNNLMQAYRDFLHNVESVEYTRFQLLRIDVLSARQHDDILLAPCDEDK